LPPIWYVSAGSRASASWPIAPLGKLDIGLVRGRLTASCQIVMP
jgi:hypothetical protein